MFTYSPISRYDTPAAVYTRGGVAAYRFDLWAETPADGVQVESMLPGVYWLRCSVILGKTRAVLPSSAGVGEGPGRRPWGPPPGSQGLPPVFTYSEEWGKIGEAIAAPCVVGGCESWEAFLQHSLPVVVFPPLFDFAGGWWSPEADRARIRIPEKNKGTVAAAPDVLPPVCLAPALEVLLCLKV